MAFDSFAALLAMEGHGPYVWTCYGVFFVSMMAISWWSLGSRKKALEACRRSQLAGTASTPESTPAGSASFARVNISQD